MSESWAIDTYVGVGHGLSQHVYCWDVSHLTPVEARAFADLVEEGWIAAEWCALAGLTDEEIAEIYI